jgi:alkylation response protein AidB-like acyl-CoA dehydrogenase
MLSFTPTEEQQMLVDAITRYALNDMRAVAHEADETSSLPAETVRKGWEIGVLPAVVPEDYGGLGEYSPITNVLAAEALAYGDLAVALAVMAPGLVGLPVLLAGTEAQQRQVLPALVEATAPGFTAALLEPGITFDPYAPRTTARREDDYYVLDGVKCYVPLADGARLMLVYARDSETGSVEGFLVEGGAEGLSIVDREKLMGLRALPLHRVKFSGVKVSAACKLGGDQPTAFARLHNHSQVALAALAVGVARGAFDYARNYAKERVQFGVPIATKQAVAFMLAEMAIEVDAARLMVWEAAWKLETDPEGDNTAESRLAKDYADKAVMMVADSAVQVLGGHGYIREHPVERWLRNARGFAAFDGLAII